MVRLLYTSADMEEETSITIVYEKWSKVGFEWKTAGFVTFTSWNLSTVLEVMEVSSSMSADVYSNLTIGLAI